MLNPAFHVMKISNLTKNVLAILSIIEHTFWSSCTYISIFWMIFYLEHVSLSIISFEATPFNQYLIHSRGLNVLYITITSNVELNFLSSSVSYRHLYTSLYSLWVFTSHWGFPLVIKVLLKRKIKELNYIKTAQVLWKTVTSWTLMILGLVV